jgi:hypothetical protein
MDAEHQPIPDVLPVKRSSSTAKLFTSLSKAQSEIAGAVKDSENPHFRSRYADLASVWEACREALTKNELAVLQPVSANGPQVTVTTILAHSSGEWISEALTLTAQQNTPQGVGSAITYGRRYGLAAMVGIAPEDDDGNAASQRSPDDTVTVTAPPTITRDLPPGSVMLHTVKPGRAGAAGELVTHTGESFLFYKKPLKVIAEQACQDGAPVLLEVKRSASGNTYVDGIRRVPPGSDGDAGRDVPAADQVF